VTMTPVRALPELRPVVFVVRHCRMSRFEVLGPDFESLPVPVFGAEGLRIARMLAPTRVDPDTQRRWVSPPSYVVEQRADTGAFAEARAVSPRVFGLDHDPSVELGEIVRPGGFADATRRLYELFDAVLPVFAAGSGVGGQAPSGARQAPSSVAAAGGQAPSPGAAAGGQAPSPAAAARGLPDLSREAQDAGSGVGLRASAGEAREAFFALAEAPLVPYYRSLGKAFFAFLDRAAEGS